MPAGHLSLRTKLVALNVGMVVVTLAVLVAGDLAFERVRIDGPLYRAIDGGQAVVADILPPPLFIVESHLAVFELIDAQAHGDTTRVGLLESRLREREADFEARHQQWARELAPGIVKSALVDASYAPAASYFRVVDRDLLPALHRNDLATARELLAHTLQPLFAEHRDRVEFTVAAARRENVEREANAAAFVDRMRIVMLAAWLALAFAAFAVVRRGVIEPIVASVVEIGAVLERIGAGDTRTPVAVQGADEFDQILRAIDRMRERLLAATETARRDAAVAGATSGAATDGTGLDVELGLRRSLDKPELYRKVLARYLQQRAATGNEIRAALETGAIETAARAAHTLISTAAMLGAPALAELARELHDAIDLAEPERWPALLARIDDVQARVDAQAAAYMQGAPSPERAIE